MMGFTIFFSHPKANVKGGGSESRSRDAIAATRNSGRSNMAARGRANMILSSVPLQFLLFLNGWYLGFFFIAEALIFIYKGQVLPYPSSNLALDIILLFVLTLIEIFRIFFCSKGNLTERNVPLSVGVGLTVPAVVLSVYLLLLQTYVLRVEVIINGILLALHGPTHSAEWKKTKILHPSHADSWRCLLCLL
ncbi:transmembrane protein 216-like isoform X3 [Lethenteron reissneri]|uniref:transmembrane protein 216-like isoform X3 n=1 Tax=Lethenteron reissneri TaxID=7753 RepID=UPI002AB729FC|nr:transmembrane protein 216-like isoform X3 [Lethenteron reissneri]